MALIRYLDTAGVGEWFGVSGAQVARWRSRYKDTHPCPEPDAVIGRTAGWLPTREAEWRAWDTARPGQGMGGGRPRKTSA